MHACVVCQLPIVCICSMCTLCMYSVPCAVALSVNRNTQRNGNGKKKYETRGINWLKTCNSIVMQCAIFVWFSVTHTHKHTHTTCIWYRHKPNARASKRTQEIIAIREKSHLYYISTLNWLQCMRRNWKNYGCVRVHCVCIYLVLCLVDGTTVCFIRYAS